METSLSSRLVNFGFGRFWLEQYTQIPHIRSLLSTGHILWAPMLSMCIHPCIVTKSTYSDQYCVLNYGLFPVMDMVWSHAGWPSKFECILITLLYTFEWMNE